MPYANEGALQSSIPSNPNQVPADNTDTPKLRVVVSYTATMLSAYACNPFTNYRI